MSEFVLEGLDGANPLGFLAALGTLRTASMAWTKHQVTLTWIKAVGGWRPKLGINADLNRDALLSALHEQLRLMTRHPVFRFADDLSVPADTFRREARNARDAAKPSDRVYADFLAAFGSDIMEGNGGQIQDTALRTMSGAGHQHFLGFVRKLVEDTTEGHLRAALFAHWQYTDPAPSMRWDPNDDRRYALRWGDPSNTSKNPIMTVRGANRLAVEGLPLLPTVPVKSRLETTGFSQRRGMGVWWTWPIWDTPITLDTVHSLLTLPELQAEQPPRNVLFARGVQEVYRSQRITRGKYRNFAPAYPV